MQAQLLNIIMEAYNGGWLQYHDMTIYGITIHMDMLKRMNKITMKTDSKEFYTMLYDSDLESTTESGMAHLLALMF
jgi:hypothetical protein